MEREETVEVLEEEITGGFLRRRLRKLAKSFKGTEGAIALSVLVLKLGVDLMKGAFDAEHEELVKLRELHAETRARLFSLETILEAQGVIEGASEQTTPAEEGAEDPTAQCSSCGVTLGRHRELEAQEILDHPFAVDLPGTEI